MNKIIKAMVAIRDVTASKIKNFNMFFILNIIYFAICDSIYSMVPPTFFPGLNMF